MKKIFITGAPRSGSTWLGKMLSINSDVNYIHEPFNYLQHGEKVLSPLKKMYEYVSLRDSSERLDSFEFYVSSFYAYSFRHMIEEIKRANGLKQALKPVKKFVEQKKYATTLIKDPIAVFSSEWINSTLNTQNVFIIRHPAAFVASMKEKDWKRDYKQFLSQPYLMEILHKYKDKIEQYSEFEYDTIDQAILFWNMIYYYISVMKLKHPEWIYVKHEDLSSEPVNEIKKLYEQLGISFTPYIENKIKEYTSFSSTPTNLKRNSKENITKWKKILTEEEVQKTYIQTKEIWELFYTEEDW